MKQIITHRVITMLGRNEVEFLDELGKDALFSTGHKLSYNEILRWLIEFAMETGVSGKNVDSLAKFKEKILKSMQERLRPKIPLDKSPKPDTLST